ncbi:hypothetical protein PFISCL1PPCAC_24797 [Pristionchus fissidentatus]|uniref:Uncharacterized protein n=1 Tax=Pristionchus fissidentatus TaxID=1538716 RepID=A0AAV5WPD9_9BILA|nr:hypothetical protein PFISCL1PPCAC_24797 [Pristionchus fissidentatus]
MQHIGVSYHNRLLLRSLRCPQDTTSRRSRTWELSEPLRLLPPSIFPLPLLAPLPFRQALNPHHPQPNCHLFD